MEDTSEHIINKSEFPEGEWMHEPDKLNWIDPATNLDCMIVRNQLGALCGYVAVDENHPLFGKDYDSIDVEVHGGLTYCNECAGHICHIPELGRPDKVWWLGFDCAHSRDLIPSMIKFNQEFYQRHPDLYSSGIERLNAKDTYKNLAYVKTECASLAKQLATYGSTD